MPINYKDYNPGFPKLSKWIRFERAKNCCEGCGIANYTVIQYVDECIDDKHPFANYPDARAFANQQNKFNKMCGRFGIRFAVVILTVAHLDQDRRNDAEDNLKALCQKCHLSVDRKHNWQRRRYGKTGQYHRQILLDI